MEKRTDEKWWERPVAVIISVPENKKSDGESSQKKTFVIQSMRGSEPFVYEYLMDKHRECAAKAHNMLDSNLKQFYLNAAEGFRVKAGNISIAEAQV